LSPTRGGDSAHRSGGQYLRFLGLYDRQPEHGRCTSRRSSWGSGGQWRRRGTDRLRGRRVPRLDHLQSFIAVVGAVVHRRLPPSARLYTSLAGNLIVLLLALNIVRGRTGSDRGSPSD